MLNDRFIANRNSLNEDYSHQQLVGDEDEQDSDGEVRTEDDPKKILYYEVLKDNLFGKCVNRILPISSTLKKQRKLCPYETTDVRRQIAIKKRSSSSRDRQREIPSICERILDAPGIIDDYYLNLLDWHSSDLLAIALNDQVYILDCTTGAINELSPIHNNEDYVSSIAWSRDEQFIAIGISSNEVQIWDVDTKTRLRSMSGHKARVGSLCWNDQILSSGSQDGLLIHRDVSLKDPIVGLIKPHEGEICGLKWDRKGKQLASGANDCLLKLWDHRFMNVNLPLWTSNLHLAAVKALDWNEKGVLASGGGTADRTIRLWDVDKGECVKSVDTGSQVCSILWSHNYPEEFVSSHGFMSYELAVWNSRNLKRKKLLLGHQGRVLKMAMSPCNNIVASLAVDEQLRFWRIFDKPKQSCVVSKSSSKLSNRNLIR